MDSKPKEELYNLKNDPFELYNLANESEYAEKLNELRNLTLKTEAQMQSENPEFTAVPVPGAAFMEWLKAEEPAEFKQMQSGIEIGYDRMIKKYKQYFL